MSKDIYWPKWVPSEGPPSEEMRYEILEKGSDTNNFFPLFFSDGSMVEEVQFKCCDCKKKPDTIKSLIRKMLEDFYAIQTSYVCKTCNLLGYEYLEVFAVDPEEGSIQDITGNKIKFLSQVLLDGTRNVYQIKREDEYPSIY
jgi:hypothetical protein